MPRIALSSSKIHITCRLPIDLCQWLDAQDEDRTTVITKAIEQYRQSKERLTYARMLRDLKQSDWRQNN